MIVETPSEGHGWGGSDLRGVQMPSERGWDTAVHVVPRSGGSYA